MFTPVKIKECRFWHVLRVSEYKVSLWRTFVVKANWSSRHINVWSHCVCREWCAPIGWNQSCYFRKRWRQIKQSIIQLKCIKIKQQACFENMKTRQLRRLCSDVERRSQRDTQLKYRYLKHVRKYSHEVFALGCFPPLALHQHHWYTVSCRHVVIQFIQFTQQSPREEEEEEEEDAHTCMFCSLFQLRGHHKYELHGCLHGAKTIQIPLNSCSYKVYF